MKTYSLFLISISLLLTSLVSGQSTTFSDDAKTRGYYNRPYLRYEAEIGKCITDGVLLTPTYDQRELQSEASNQSAVTLMNKGSYVQWTNQSDADGLTLRFSLPDGTNGEGMKGTFDLYVNSDFAQSIAVDSHWAWQYILKNGSKYPDNTPNASTKFPRMRFDETRVKLNNNIPANATFKLVKADDNNTPYTIDFVELEAIPEPITFESITDANKIMYTPDKGAINYFIASNTGKTIFIPAGRYETDKRIYIYNGTHTKILGAGMWHTEIYFSASSDERGTYNQRGIEAYGDNIVLQDLFLNTINNKRYYNNNDAYQVGKGLMGSFGTNSLIKNVWIEHFECGGWIEGAENLTIQNSRFRNNYADGINLANGCKNSVVEMCSFRNNGDDDMASWSRANGLCINNTYRYCTSENNWRASSIGFFGGEQNKAHHCVIIDPMEAGFRVTSDFPGAPFSNNGYTEFHDISVYKGGVKNGAVGVDGDLWGNQQGAIHINSTSQYDIQNIRIQNIDLYNSKNNAVFIGCSSKYIRNLVLNNIHIEGTGNYGLYFYGTKGNGTYCNITYNNIGASTHFNPIPTAFSFLEDCGSSVEQTTPELFKAYPLGRSIFIYGTNDTTVSLYDMLGKVMRRFPLTSSPIEVKNALPGLYIVSWDTPRLTQKVIVH